MACVRPGSSFNWRVSVDKFLGDKSERCREIQTGIDKVPKSCTCLNRIRSQTMQLYRKAGKGSRPQLHEVIERSGYGVGYQHKPRGIFSAHFRGFRVYVV